METVVLELNQNNADYIPKNNGEYQVTLAENIEIREGDTVNLRMASIDSQKVDSNTIVIGPEGVNLGITFSIYDVDYDKTDKRVQDNTGDWPNATYDYFAAYNGVELRQLTDLTLDIIGYNAPYFNGSGQPGRRFSSGGSYVVNDSIGTKPPNSWEFTCTIQYIDSAGETQTGKLTGTNAIFGYAPGDHSQEGGQLWQASGSSVKMTPISPIEYKEGSISVLHCDGYWADKAHYPAEGDAGGSIYPGFTGNPLEGNPTAVPVKSSQFKLDKDKINGRTLAPGNTQLDLKTSTAQLREGTYDPKSLAIALTQLFNSAKELKAASSGSNQLYEPTNPMLQRTDDDKNLNMLFRQVDFGDAEPDIQFTNANTYRYVDSGGTPIPYFVGATQFALDYGSAGEVFSLNYAHMPLFNSTPGPSGQPTTEQQVGLYWTGTKAGNDLRYHLIKQSSGIVIHDLQPASFWRDQLGLYEQLITPLSTTDNGTKYYTKKTMEEKITYGYASLESFILVTNHSDGTTHDFPIRKMTNIPPRTTAGNTTPPYYLEVTGETRALIGNTTQVNNSGGYYLVEVLGLAPRRGGYVDDRENNSKMTAIVSKQYDSNNVITGFAESGIEYTHFGMPYSVNSLKVRILDPKTKLPVTDLGPNNTLFFDIQRTPQIIREQEIAAQKASK